MLFRPEPGGVASRRVGSVEGFVEMCANRGTGGVSLPSGDNPVRCCSHGRERSVAADPRLGLDPARRTY